jgi:triosephosphate isomerase (TIM)
MRKKIVAGNWKMNLTLTEANALAIDVLHEWEKNTPVNVKVILCPPFPFIKAVADKVAAHPSISVGAQNCASENSGAYTGEVSAKMIESLVAHYVIIGHSERRALFFESDAVLVKKLGQVLANNLTPIFCCGETLSEREGGKHFSTIKEQISAALFHLSESDFSKLIIAYEPVWAIGTGVTASSAQAQEMHQFIRKTLSEKFGEAAAQNCSLLYGGSCNAANAAELFAMPDVDGGLIGGASLKAKDFITIANSF